MRSSACTQSVSTATTTSIATTLLDAQMSAPVAAALAIVLGDVTATMFVPETLDRPDVRALIERVDAKIDDECERIYPGVRSGVGAHRAARRQRAREARARAERRSQESDDRRRSRGEIPRQLRAVAGQGALRPHSGAMSGNSISSSDVTQFFKWG